MSGTNKISKNKTIKNPNRAYPANVEYPASEDVFAGNIESEIDPEDTSRIKQSNENDGKFNEKNFNYDKSGSDLDIPGSELDDQQEEIGSEDEENNGYSLGGDNHTDLEENENKQ